MQTIGLMRNYSPIPEGAEVGVEVEVEADSEIWDPYDSTCWNLVSDNSLRGYYNGEYVLKTPLPKKAAINAVNLLASKLKGSGVNDSFRAGVHIHVNVRDLTFDQLMSFYAYCMIIDEAFVDWCGPTRRGNHFCLRVKDAEYALWEFVNAYKKGHVKHLLSDNIRYSSINLKPLYSYGSVEFRSLQTKPGLKNIQPAIELLLHLKQKAVETYDPKFITESFSGIGPIPWCKELLGSHYNLFKDQPDIERKLWEGMRLAQDLIFFSKG
jgi:hypothetical protein